MTSHSGIVIRALTWNLFHGRDHPPDPALLTWRSRLLGTTERGGRYAQVNRSLRHEFARVLAGLDWDVALLQEAPPRWLEHLGRACAASGASALTDRNRGAALRAAVADRNPDLIASGEGGSNQLLVRAPARLVEVRRLSLTRRPERRRMLFAVVRQPNGAALAVANLHATAGDRAAAARDVELAAERAVQWAGELPLLFGGDLNLSPKRDPGPFEALARGGFTPPGERGAIDHLLGRRLEPAEPPASLPAAARELPEDGLRIRLSDHDLVAAAFGLR